MLKHHSRLSKFVLVIILVTMFLTIAGLLFTIVQLQHELFKAQVCNKVFVKYLHYNYGMNINLDRIYEDGVKWVDDPQYQ